MADCYGKRNVNNQCSQNSPLSSWEDAAMNYMDSPERGNTDLSDKRTRVKKCFEEIKKLFPNGQQLTSIEALESVVAQFKKFKDKTDVTEPAYNEENADCEKNFSQNTSLCQLDEDEIMTMYNSVTFLDSILKFLRSSCDEALTDVSTELLKDWEQKNSSSSQLCSIKTDFPRLPSYKSSDKSIQLLCDNTESPMNGQVALGPHTGAGYNAEIKCDEWGENMNCGSIDQQPRPSQLTEDNLLTHQKSERLKYLELFENDENLGKFIPSLKQRARKRRATCTENSPQNEGGHMTQGNDVMYQVATKFIKDNSGSAVQPQQTNFSRQMFQMTHLESTNLSPALGNHIGFNGPRFHQMCNPQLLNMPSMACLNPIATVVPSPQQLHTSQAKTQLPQTKPPPPQPQPPQANPPQPAQEAFRFGRLAQFKEVSSYTCPPPQMTVVSSLPLVPLPVNIGNFVQAGSKNSTNTSMSTGESKNTSGLVSLEWTDTDQSATTREPFWLENVDVPKDAMLQYEVKLKDDEEFLKDFKNMEQSGAVFEQLMECDDSDIGSDGDSIFMPTTMPTLKDKKAANPVDTDTDSNCHQYLYSPSRSHKIRHHRRKLNRDGFSLSAIQEAGQQVDIHAKKNSSQGSDSSGKKSGSGYEGSFEGGSSITSSDDLGVFQFRHNPLRRFQPRGSNVVEQSNLVVEQLTELLQEIGAPTHLEGYNQPEQDATVSYQKKPLAYHTEGNTQQIQSDVDSLVSESVSLTSNSAASNSNSLFSKGVLFPGRKQANLLDSFSEASSMFHQSSGIGTMSTMGSIGSSNKLEEAGDMSSSVHSNNLPPSDDLSGGNNRISSAKGRGRGKLFTKVRSTASSDQWATMKSNQARGEFRWPVEVKQPSAGNKWPHQVNENDYKPQQQKLNPLDIESQELAMKLLFNILPLHDHA